ncbi:hypothetical protein [uncultured Tateyamaria sp.]|uniref:hypothetical protein n=1 Tax=uncultured Tateyamaria sp. TaxID=455651 RepID=UPI00260AC520|nr:hypothetical protein [uncultured Tateyamaria sp.]
MKNFAASVVGSLDKGWLFRAYLIGALCFCWVMGMRVMAAQDPNFVPSSDTPSVGFFFRFSLISTILFPFAKIVWNVVRDFILGDTVLISNAAALFLGKFIVNLALWTMAIFIAPIGIGYLWYSQRALTRDKASIQSGEGL